MELHLSCTKPSIWPLQRCNTSCEITSQSTVFPVTFSVRHHSFTLFWKVQIAKWAPFATSGTANHIDINSWNHRGQYWTLNPWPENSGYCTKEWDNWLNNNAPNRKVYIWKSSCHELEMIYSIPAGFLETWMIIDLIRVTLDVACEMKMLSSFLQSIWSVNITSLISHWHFYC